MVKTAPRLILILSCLLALGGCGAVKKWFQPKPPYSVLQPHESWCYSTLGDADCYDEPQDLPPETLLSVDPPSRYPLTREEYMKVLAEARLRKQKLKEEGTKKDLPAPPPVLAPSPATPAGDSMPGAPVPLVPSSTGVRASPR